MSETLYYLDCYRRNDMNEGLPPSETYGPATLEEIMTLNRHLVMACAATGVSYSPRGLNIIGKDKWPAEWLK